MGCGQDGGMKAPSDSIAETRGQVLCPTDGTQRQGDRCFVPLLAHTLTKLGYFRSRTGGWDGANIGIMWRNGAGC
jgi:hypothetical protein